MTLNIKKLASYLGSVLCILICSLSVNVTVQADILLKGSMKIGDNDTYRIHPSYLLTAKNSNSNSNLQNPQAFNPINFNLTEDINLTQIQLQNAASINASLYFVIWNSNGGVMVNTRSSYSLYANSQSFNANLPAGDYQIAVIGQCLKLKSGGWRPQGWKKNCSSSNGKKSYDDFYFSDIKLVTPQTSNSITFLQRRHIGDSDELRYDGYGGRWYQDQHDGDDVEYEFSPPQHTTLKSITIYNYRDLIANANNVKLTLSGPNLITQTTYMNTGYTSGDFVWQLNKTLLPGGKYELEIEVDDEDDADDISWDDIVIKFGSDTPPPDVINHYRLTYSDRALTCEPAVVTVQACTNNFQSGRACVESTYSTSVTLVADAKNSADSISEPSGAFTGSIDINLGYLQEADLTLSLTDINGKAYRCNGSTNCNINFADTGFFFSYDNAGGSDNITNQVAGVNFSKPIRLDAFYNDNGQCKNIFKNNENIPVNLGIQCKEPGTCSTLDFIANNIKLGKNSGNQSANYKPVDLKFNQNGTQIDGALYQDAGKINLIASYTINDNRNNLNGLTIKGSSNQFAVRPYRFKINAEDKPITVDLTAQDTSGTLINTHKAGEDFSFSVTAMNANRVTTTNYQPDSNAILKLKLTRTIPDVDGADGKFAYANNVELSTQLVGTWQDARNLTAFKNGISTFESANYSEVGAFSMNIQDTDYYGMAFSVDAHAEDDSNGTEIGRFIPSHFKLVSSSVDNYVGSYYDYIFPQSLSSYVTGTTVLQKKDNQVYECREWPYVGFCGQWSEGSNQYEPGVGSAWEKAWTLVISSDYDDIFTYMDQPELVFDYRLEAQNALGFVTRNYASDKAVVTFIADSDGLDFSSRLQDFGGEWCYGVYQPGSCDVDSISSAAGDQGIFSRLVTGEDGPIINTFFGIAITDLDGVELVDQDITTNMNTAKRLSTQKSELRYGRWFIYDGSGPTGSAFPVTMELQYYDALTDSFIVNTDDSQTTFSASGAGATINDDASGITLSDCDNGSCVFSRGTTRELMISSDNPGTAILEYIETPEWLMPADGDDPSARITFDFFYGNDRVIYRRRLN